MQVVLCWLKENCEAKASSAQTLKFIMLIFFVFFYLCLCINNLIVPFLYLYFVHCAVGNSIIVVTLCPKLNVFVYEFVDHFHSDSIPRMQGVGQLASKMGCINSSRQPRHTPLVNREDDPWDEGTSTALSG